MLETMERDTNGVVHINGKDPAATFYGLGYAHGMDRGLQLLMTRIAGEGRICECLHDSDDMLTVDMFFKRINLKANMDRQLQEIKPEVKALIDAYCDGVNAALRRKTPWELKLLG